MLFVFVVLAHDRRQILHVNVTGHPTAAWTAQQIRHAFPWDTAPRFLLRDRDGTYGDECRACLDAMGIDEVLTAPRSPWQNPYVERLIGSMRRECVDHVVVLNERSLQRILRSYIDYYHHWRTHLALGKDPAGESGRRAGGPGRGHRAAARGWPASQLPSTGGLTATTDGRRLKTVHADAAAGGTSEGRQPTVDFHRAHVCHAYAGDRAPAQDRAISHANRAYEVFGRHRARTHTAGPPHSKPCVWPAARATSFAVWKTLVRSPAMRARVLASISRGRCRTVRR